MVEVSVIDACAFHDWPENTALLPYVSEGWGELIKDGLMIKSMWRAQHPRQTTKFLGWADAAPPKNVPQGWADSLPPGGGPPASDSDFLIKQLIEERGCDRVVLGHQEGLLSAGMPMPYAARTITRALNDWTVAEWFDRDERLFGHLLVASAMPDEAAAEIRRLGENERFVAVAMGANGLNKVFGHPAYFPIYTAASEFDLPIVIQVAGDNIIDLGTSPVSGGPTATWAEYDAMCATPLMTHMSSFIASGVFDLYPDLKVLLVGGGVAWLPEYLWRLDWNYKFARRVDVPWMNRVPSEYFVEHVRMTTQSMEAPANPEHLEIILDLIPELENILLYASGYPYVRDEAPNSVASRLPTSWHERVFRENAERLYRWPGGVGDGKSTATREQIVEREK